MKNLYSILLLMICLVQVSLAQTYCTSAPNSNIDGDIVSVKIGGFKNLTACSSLTGTIGTANGTAGIYSNFADTNKAPIYLRHGNSTWLKVEVSSCNNNTFATSTVVFFDWNHDGDFLDTMERYNLVSLANGNHLDSILITPPLFAIFGNTVMRVICSESTAAANVSSCGSYAFGETEDYRIILSDYICPEIAVIVGPSPVTVNLGSPFTLVDSIGYGLTKQFSYNWYKYTTILNTYTVNLSSSSIQYGDTGCYHTVVNLNSLSCPPITSNTVCIKVNPPAGSSDSDGDGVSDNQEGLDGTDPFNMCSYVATSIVLNNASANWKAADCDGDGRTNLIELNTQTNSLDPCSFVGNMTVSPSTSWLAMDCDGDGVINSTELSDSTQPGNLCSFKVIHQTVATSQLWKGSDCDGDGVINSTEIADETEVLGSCSRLVAHITSQISSPCISSPTCSPTNPETLLSGPSYVRGNTYFPSTGATMTGTVSAKHGTVSLLANNKFLYTPNNTYNGIDTVTRIICLTDSSNGGLPVCHTCPFYFNIVSSSGSINCANYKNFTLQNNGTNQVFTAQSVPSPYYATYYWQFSNGTTSTSKIATTQFTSTYNWAKLKICITDSMQNLVCCDSSKKDSIMVNNCNLTCSLTVKGDTLFPVIYNNGAIYTKPALTTGWSSSGGSVSYGTITKKFAVMASNGTFVCTYNDSNGCSTTCSYTRNVVPTNPCISAKNFSYQTSNGTVYFSPYNAPGYNLSTIWSFGNGSSSTAIYPTTTYTTSGAYLVKYKYCITDSAQNTVCCDSISKYVTVNVPVVIPCNLVANFGSKLSAFNIGTVEFKDSSSPTSTAYTYLWTFGDGTSSTQKNPVKMYAANGTYTVCLKVRRWINTNNMYCEDSICKTVTIFNVNPCNKLVPSFNYSVVNGAYILTNTTNMTGFNPVSIKYTISPTNTVYNHDSASHTFAKNGYANICMTISVFDPSTGVSCTKSTCKYIYITNSICGCLKANFSFAKSANSVSTYNFLNTSTCVDTNTTYSWNFGNGATASTKNVTYTYSNAGFYKVVMYSTKGNCVDSSVRYIQIYMTDPCHDSGYVNNITNCSNYVYPVCGCDSMTYQNSCFAYKAGVKKYRIGPCVGDTNYVKICGYIYNDINANCIADSTDMPRKNTSIRINTVPVTYLSTNAQGYYSIYLPKGTYKINQVLGYSTFPTTQICPANNDSITVNASTGGVTYCNNNFYDTSSTCPDLSVSIKRYANITPGFPSMKRITYNNNGATAINNVVVHYTFLNGLIPTNISTPYTISGNTITWNLGTVPAYTSSVLNANFSTPVSMPLGTTHLDSAWIEPSTGDCNPSNNYSYYTDTCVGSWDPNDKAASPAAGSITKETKVIDYHVRFQNTGTAPAHNVVIADEIDNNFERSSFKINSASHPYTFNFKDDGKLYVEFENIMLPDSGTDYEASQGYVDYSVYLKPNLSVGTKLNNTAAIYFDYNDPVITNTTTHTIVLKSTQGITNVGQDMNISIYPNPTQDKAILKINLDKSSQIVYSIFDLNGKQLLSKELKKSADFSDEINLESMAPGIYILNIKVNDQVNSFTIIKE